MEAANLSYAHKLGCGFICLIRRILHHAQHSQLYVVSRDCKRTPRMHRYQRCAAGHPTRDAIHLRIESDFIRRALHAPLLREAIDAAHGTELSTFVLGAVYRHLEKRVEATRISAQITPLSDGEMSVLRDVATAIIASPESAGLPRADEAVLFALSVDPTWLMSTVLGKTDLQAAFFTLSASQREAIYNASLKSSARGREHPTAIFFEAQRLLRLLGSARVPREFDGIAGVIKAAYAAHNPPIIVGWAHELDTLDNSRLLKVALDLIVDAGRRQIETVADVVTVVSAMAPAERQRPLRPGRLPARCVSELLRWAASPPVSLQIATWTDALAQPALIKCVREMGLSDEAVFTDADRVLQELKASLVDRTIPFCDLEQFVQCVHDRPEAIDLFFAADDDTIKIDRSFVSNCEEVIQAVRADANFVDTFLLAFCPVVVEAGFEIADLADAQTEWTGFKEAWTKLPASRFVTNHHNHRLVASWLAEQGVHGAVLRSPAAAIVRKHPQLGQSRVFCNAVRAAAPPPPPRNENADENAGAGDGEGVDETDDLIAFDDSDVDVDADGNTLADFLTHGLAKIQQQLSDFAAATTLEQTLGNASVVWNGVFKLEDVDSECELLIHFGASRFSCERDRTVNRALRSRAIAEQLRVQAEQLGTVAEIFGYADCDSPVRDAIAVLTEIDDSGTLGQLHEATRQVQRSTSTFSEEMWELVEALSGSKELVDFVVNNLHEDMHALIDAVEEK